MDLDKTSKQKGNSHEETEETETHSGVPNSFSFLFPGNKENLGFNILLYPPPPHTHNQRFGNIFYNSFRELKKSLFLIVHVYIKWFFVICNSYLPLSLESLLAKREAQMSIIEQRHFPLVLRALQCLLYHILSYYIKITYFDMMKWLILFFFIAQVSI